MLKSKVCTFDLFYVCTSEAPQRWQGTISKKVILLIFTQFWSKSEVHRSHLNKLEWLTLQCVYCTYTTYITFNLFYRSWRQGCMFQLQWGFERLGQKWRSLVRTRSLVPRMPVCHIRKIRKIHHRITESQIWATNNGRKQSGFRIW